MKSHANLSINLFENVKKNVEQQIWKKITISILLRRSTKIDNNHKKML